MHFQTFFIYLTPWLFTKEKDNTKCYKNAASEGNDKFHGWMTVKLQTVGMRNVQDTLQTRKRSFFSSFSAWLTLPLTEIKKLSQTMELLEPRMKYGQS